MNVSISPTARLRSFRSQSALHHGVLVTLLALAFPALFGFILSTQQHRSEAQALNMVAQNIARTLAAGLQTRSHQIQALAGNPDLWGDGLASPAVKRALDQAHATTPHSSWLGVADAQGTVRTATGTLLEGLSVAKRPWFQAGLKGAHVGDVHEAVMLSKLLAPAAAEPLRFVDFAAPIVVDGRVVGVLCQHGSWAWAQAVVALLAPADARQMGLDIFIFDRQHRTIYAPENTLPPTLPAGLSDAQALNGDALIEARSDGVEYLVAAARMHMPPGAPAGDLGWTVVVRKPTAVALALARRSIGLALLVGVLCAALAAVLAWAVAGRLSQPLSNMAAAARDVEAEVAGAAIPIDTSSHEMAGLSTALSGMTRRLQRSREELEALVEERTRALQMANAELQSLARHDPLTGLMNRRAFDERLQQAFATARRSRAPVSLLIMDADHFKQVNDGFGHDAGDQVLQALAAMLDARLRETDCAARLGGEEFAVLLPATDAPGALFMAQDLVLRAANLVHAGVGPVTVSMGVASVGPLAMAEPGFPARLLRQADLAMYAAKAAGRNRALAYHEPVIADAT